MLEEMKADPKLMQEYENTFDSEEKVSNALKITRENFTIDTGVVDFDSLLVPDPIKKGRERTYLGLSTSVGELGILSPIHVMITEGYATWVENNPDEEYEGPKYILLDGFRRVYAGLKNGISRCTAIIWDFKDKDKGNELSLILARILNREQKHTWEEIWTMYQILNAQAPLTDGTVEYLLQLDMGDAPKLKSVMQNAEMFPEPREELLANKKTLQQAYTMLEKMMKEVDTLSKDDKTGIADMEQAEGVVDEAGDQRLSDQEVQEILEMSDSLDEELSEDDFDELAGNNIEADRFEVHGDRHLDPKLRAAVLQRDNYQCQVTGFGAGLPAEVALAILQVHHKVPVSDGGTNDMDNLITLSQDPHTLIHVIQSRRGRLNMKKEDFDALPENMQDYLKKVMKLARIAVEADKRCGKTKEQIRKESSGRHYQMPGAILSENLNAIKAAKEE